MFWLKTAEQRDSRTEERKNRKAEKQKNSGTAGRRPAARPDQSPNAIQGGTTSIEGRPTCFSLYRPPKNHQRPMTPKYRKPLRPPYSVRGRNGGRFPGEDRTREEILSVSPPQFFLGSVFLLKKNGTNLKEKKQNIEEKKRLSPPQKGDLASFSMLGFNGISQQYRKQLPPQRPEPQQR